ncbi:MAG: hypothetical protein QOH70_1483 [Blastocatellia bacterium]|jgi:hypothetical protein|nr:hypothetical protein [Blastocatellia bacterium]
MSDQIEADGAAQPERNDERPPDLYAVRITAGREVLAKIIREFALDVGCRPHAELKPDGSAALLAYATKERIDEMKAAGYGVELGENVSAIGRERQAEVGKGDRFEGGRVAPRGLGEKTVHGRKGGATR